MKRIHKKGKPDNLYTQTLPKEIRKKLMSSREWQIERDRKFEKDLMAEYKIFNNLIKICEELKEG